MWIGVTFELLLAQMTSVGPSKGLYVGQRPEQFEQAPDGKLMIWMPGLTASAMDANDFVCIGHSAHIPGTNYARYRNPVYDRLYERKPPNARRRPIGPAVVDYARSARAQPR